MRSAMEAIIKPYNSYSYSSKKVSVLDFMDRCCCRYTPIILSILMLIISGKIDMFDKPINCMLPNEFSESWSSYVHQFCYVTGTYIKDYDHHGNVKPIYVGYYQWVPFILIIQAIAMRLPYFFWRFGQSKTDIDFGHVHALGNKIRSDDGGNRAKAVKEAANYIYNVAELREFKGLGQMIVFFHIAFKLMNVFMIGLMIYFLTVFIGYRNPFWGISLARQAWPNHEYSLQQNQPLTYFPRIAYCKFSMDFLGNSVDGMVREVRCTLGINMLNEKVFLFLYFWYYALLVMVIMDAFFFARFLSSFKRIQCVKDLLHLVSRDDPFDEKKVVRFCQRVLGHDGLLIFRFIHQNFGKLIAMEICAQLYHVDITKHPAGHTNAAHCSTEGAGTTSTSPTIPMDTLIEQIEASNEPASISLQH